MTRRTLVIQVEPGETYQDSLLRRLKEYHITQRALCEAIGMDPSQFSRIFGRPSEHTGEPVGIGINKVLELEEALETIRARRRAEAASKKK